MSRRAGNNPQPEPFVLETSVAEMIPVIAPSVAKKETDCCLFVASTDGGQKMTQQSGSIWHLPFHDDVDVGRPDFLKPALCAHV